MLPYGVAGRDVGPSVAEELLNGGGALVIVGYDAQGNAVYGPSQPHGEGADGSGADSDGLTGQADTAPLPARRGRRAGVPPTYVLALAAAALALAAVVALALAAVSVRRAVKARARRAANDAPTDATLRAQSHPGFQSSPGDGRSVVGAAFGPPSASAWAAGSVADDSAYSPSASEPPTPGSALGNGGLPGRLRVGGGWGVAGGVRGPPPGLAPVVTGRAAASTDDSGAGLLGGGGGRHPLTPLAAAVDRRDSDGMA